MPEHGPPGQPSFSRRPAPQNAGAGGGKTARLKGRDAPLRRGLASDLPPNPQPHGGRDMGTDHWRFAGGKPGIAKGRQHLGAIPPARETPAADRPP
ncbi:myosin I heavy chain kinase (plasmid) [Roseobacter denitrificans OCh 114]|uniref:Myosin I heavy chain kinase n=1 Tax=Roseobacter denitrificans (strain ATCC 33942 / OCh 114) TaxID=375451 RepID=Q07GC9_ROSDO|nr:myosin I heavy chain kinase [Roseobacter denitrificans OCh 114]